MPHLKSNIQLRPGDMQERDYRGRPWDLRGILSLPLPLTTVLQGSGHCSLWVWALQAVGLWLTPSIFPLGLASARPPGVGGRRGWSPDGASSPPPLSLLPVCQLLLHTTLRSLHPFCEVSDEILSGRSFVIWKKGLSWALLWGILGSLDELFLSACYSLAQNIVVIVGTRESCFLAEWPALGGPCTLDSTSVNCTGQKLLPFLFFLETTRALVCFW